MGFSRQEYWSGVTFLYTFTWCIFMGHLLCSRWWGPVNPKGDQPWLFIGRTDAEVEAPILWPPDRKSRLIGKDPNSLIEGRSRGWQRMRSLDSIPDSMDMNLRKLQEMVKDREDWPAAVHGVTESQTRPSNWTTTWKSGPRESSLVKMELHSTYFFYSVLFILALLHESYCARS